jgi:hypothetical protein
VLTGGDGVGTRGDADVRGDVGVCVDKGDCGVNGRSDSGVGFRGGDDCDENHVDGRSGREGSGAVGLACSRSQHPNSASVDLSHHTIVFNAVFSSGGKGDEMEGGGEEARSGTSWLSGLLATKSELRRRP